MAGRRRRGQGQNYPSSGVPANGLGSRLSMLGLHWPATRAPAPRAGAVGAPRAGAEASADELVRQTLSWFAVAALAYRLAITPILVAGALGNLETDLPRSLLVAMAVVLAGDLVLLVGVLAGRFGRLLRSSVFFAVDLAVAAGLNLWATSTLPHGTFLLTGRDIVWGYCLGVISFWTAIRGPRTGAAILAGGVVLHLLMARLNGAAYDFDGWMTFVARIAWLALAFALAWVLVALASRGGRAAVAEGLRAGREAERARLLRETHDTVLQTLEAIALRSDGDAPPAERLREIRATALQQAASLRAVLREDTARQGGLVAGLRALTEEFLARGLHTELVTGELAGDPPPAVTAALVGATREALTNVAKHAGTGRAVVRAVSRRDGVEVTVRDHGCGFDPGAERAGFGVDRSIVARMREVAGRAELWSAPGRGTRVTLWVPG
jgi:signal transduction histidine kinase